MEKAGIYPQVQSKLVMSKGLNAAYQFLITGNAEVGFLAKSQLYQDGKIAAGSYWEIPSDLYTPITQDVAVLNDRNIAAVAFAAYLTSERAKKLIAGFGYH
jgi:molybdate transport system substrate-binding protein